MKKLLKSRTFWGGLIYAIAVVLESVGVLDNATAETIKTAGVGVGLYGARNARPIQ